MQLWNGVEIPKMMWNISTPDDYSMPYRCSLL